MSPKIIQPYVKEASCVLFQAELLSICTGRGVFRVEHLGNTKFNGEVPSTIQHCQHAPPKKWLHLLATKKTSQTSPEKTTGA